MSTPAPAGIPEAKPNTFRLVIDFDPATGEIGIIGPIENPMIFLSMLEMAKVVMMEQRAKSQRIAAVPTLPPGFDLSKLTRH